MEASFRKASDRVAALFNRRPGGEEHHTFVAPELPLPRDWPEKLAFRKRPKPYTRSIAWTPTGADAGSPTDRPYELFVAQSVLSEVRQHLITATTGEPFGFLIGQVVYCPWAEAPYLVIDSVRRETEDLPPANDMDRFRHAWVAASRDARRRRSEVIGWYHRHGVLGLRLSEWDLHLQEEFFPEPWHCALVIASSSRGIIGGFIQRSRRARLFRKGLAPFHEMVELDAKRIDGLRPSVVDWENYAAGEAVSVIRARWPGARERQKAWRAKEHGEGVQLPTQGGSVAPATSRPLGRGGFAGRRWRADPSEGPTKTSPRPKQTDRTSEKKAPEKRKITEDDFADAVGSAPDTVAYESEVSLDDDRPSRATKKKPGTTPRRPAAGGKPTSGTTGRPPATRKGKKPQRTDEAGTDEAWYSSDFLDAVWGPAPFEPEEEEEPVTREAADAEDAEKPVTDSKGRPRFELVPTFEPEEPEVDSAGSLDWLLSLIGDTLAARSAVPDAVPSEEVGDSGRTREPSGIDAPTVDQAAATAAAAAGVERQIPMPGVDTRKRRPSKSTYVTSSVDPDSDPEAPIPVVFPAGEKKWRPSERQKQVAGAGAILFIVAILLQTFLGGREAVQPPRGSQGGPIVAPAPSAEFAALAEDFLTTLQTLRRDLVEFRLGRVECDALATDVDAMAAAHLAMSDYVAGDPEVSDRFARLDSDFDVAVSRFVATGCPVPASLGAPGGANPDPGD